MADEPSLTDIVCAIKAAEDLGRQSTGIVGVDGCGGAGKTTLARQLGVKLNAEVIHTDDFASWDNPLDWHQRLLDQVLEPLSQNKPARYQRYDWGRKMLAEWYDVPVQPWVILEGVSSTRAMFRPFLRYAIFVDAPQDIRLKRGLARDGQDALPLWNRWQTDENIYLASHDPKAFANLVLDGTRPILDP